MRLSEGTKRLNVGSFDGGDKKGDLGEPDPSIEGL